MRALPIDREMRDFAREQNLYIVQVCITGQYTKDRDGGTATTGPCSKRHAEELEAFFWKWRKRVFKANEKLMNKQRDTQRASEVVK